MPFHINIGRFTRIGRNVYINHACSFLDMGTITIEDDVLIKRNAWIGAAATILPGVTVGENAVISAGALVHKDVPDNTVVAGVPARVVRDWENL